MSLEISQWNRNANLNDFDDADGGMKEGMKRSGVNDSGRERMRAHAEYYDDPEFLDLMRDQTTRAPFTVTRLSANVVRITSGAEDVSAKFPTDRRVRMLEAGTPTDTFVAGATYSNPNTDVTVVATVPALIDSITLHHSSTLKKLAFANEVADLAVTPEGFTNADVDAALAIIQAAGSGTLLLLEGTYTIDGAKTITVPIKIIGQGIGVTITKLGATYPDSQVWFFAIPASKTSSMSALTIDGSVGTGAVGVLNAIRAGGADSNFFVDRVEVKDTETTGVIFQAPGLDFFSRFTECRFDNIGTDGAKVEDISTESFSVGFSGCSFNDTGQLVNDSGAIKAAGKVLVDDCIITGLDRGGAAVQRGVWLTERLAVDPNGQDGRFSTVTGCTISGSGQNARGIECDGRRNTVSVNALDMSGSVSRGIFLGGTGGQQDPRGNAITGNVITNANIGIETESSVRDNNLDSNNIYNCTTGLSVRGDNNSHTGNKFRDCGTDIIIQAGSVENAVSAVDSKGATTSLSVLSGADRNYFSALSIKNATTGVSCAGDDNGFDGIECHTVTTGISVAGDDNDFSGINCHSCTKDVVLSGIRNNFTGTRGRNGTHGFDVEATADDNTSQGSVFVNKSVSAIAIAALALRNEFYTPRAIICTADFTDLGTDSVYGLLESTHFTFTGDNFGNVYPGIGADGSRSFKVEIHLPVAGVGVVEFLSGPAGDTSDTTVRTLANGDSVVFPFVPGAGDVFSVEETSGTIGTSDIFITEQL